MSSRWSTLAIPFVGGIDTKSDPKSAPVAKLVELENGVFTKRGSIRKRRGYDLVDVSDTSVTVTPLTIASRENNLTAFTEDKVYTYDTTGTRWWEADAFSRVTLTGEESAYIQGTVTQYSVAVSNGYRMETYYDTYAGESVCRIMTATGNNVLFDTSSSVYSNPKAVKVGEYIHLYYTRAATTTLYCSVLNPFDIDAFAGFSGSAGVITDLNGAEIYDVAPTADKQSALVAWYSTDAGSTLRYARLSPSGTVDRAATTNETGTLSVVGIGANSDYMGIVYYNGVDTKFERIAEPEGLFTQTHTLAGDTFGTAAIRATVVGTDDRLDMIYEIAGASNTFNDVRKYIWTNAGTAANSTLKRHCGIATSGFSTGEKGYVWVKHESQIGLQNSYFLINAVTNDVVGRAEYGTATAIGSDVNLGVVNVVGMTAYCGMPFRRRVISTYDEALENTGLKRYTIQLEQTNFKCLELGETLLTTGGILGRFDGNGFEENGPLLFPEPNIDITSSDPADHPSVDVSVAGNLDAGIYGYRICYEFFDTNETRIRSASIPFSVDVPASREVIIDIPTLQHTNLPTTQVSVVVYRTKVNGTLYYRVSDWDVNNDTGDNRYVFNATTDTVEFIDNVADADITSNEIYPLAGGGIEPIEPPACNYLTETSNRVWAAGGDIPPTRVYFSKLRGAGESVDFGDTLYVDLPNQGGAVTGLATLNDVVVVFKEDQIYAISGDGPDNNGNGAYAIPQRLTADVGCSDGRSIVETPQGIMFQTGKGIYLLGNNFQVTYIGADVEAYNGQTIVSADLIPDQNLVIFLSSDGTTLAFDYLFQQWTTFTGHQGKAATVWNGNYTFIRSSDSAVLSQNADKYTDGGAHYRMQLKTAPIRLEDLQQYWRCRRVYVLGEYFSDHDLRMNIWFNREKAPQETVTWDVSSFIEVSRWGDEATWGAGDAWGGDINALDYQMSYRLARQKVQSVSFEFIEVPGTEVGRSFELTELALEWAPKTGLGRLEAARRK